MERTKKINWNTEVRLDALRLMRGIGLTLLALGVVYSLPFAFDKTSSIEDFAYPCLSAVGVLLYSLKEVFKEKK